MGTWYEIAKFPQYFEKGLVGVTATYSVLPNGKVRVINSGYWILELGKDYEYAVVGDQSRKYLWILARNSRMDEAVYQDLLQKIKEKDFDITRLEKNPQK